MLLQGLSNGNFFEYSGYTTGDLIDDNPMNTEEEPALIWKLDRHGVSSAYPLPGITLYLRHLRQEQVQLSWKTVMI